MRLFRFFVVCLSLVSGLNVHARPNVVIILADDLGFSDVGCFGSEIHTPNIDSLAADGLRITQFYNASRCCPSRASLLTGLYPHQTGVGLMTSDHHLPGYTGHLSDSCVTIARVLKSAGYKTYGSGKWHVGPKPDPIDCGFDDFYGFTRAYATDSFKQTQYVRLPEGRPKRAYAADQFYTTDAITDYALDFLDDARNAQKPYFLYLAYGAAHFPLQAPKADIATYADTYKVGWDKIRDARLARQRELGVVSDKWDLSPLSPYSTLGYEKQGVNPPWASLDPDRQTDLARRMAIYAAMIDRMDQQVGRVLASLREHGEEDNTLVFFLSDNGACAEWDPFGFDGSSGPKNVLHRGADLETMGGPTSYLSYGSAWANACNTPFRMFKHFAHEGGVSTPFIVRWPAGCKRQGQIDSRVGHLVDLMPTCVDAAGATYPQTHDGHVIQAMEGQSLLPALRGEPATERTLFFEHEGNKAVRAGKWKLVSRREREPLPWELYDMDADRTELHDVASQYPDRVRALAAEYDVWANRCHVVPAPHVGPATNAAKPPTD